MGFNMVYPTEYWDDEDDEDTTTSPDELFELPEDEEPDVYLRT